MNLSHFNKYALKSIVSKSIEIPEILSIYRENIIIGQAIFMYCSRKAMSLSSTRFLKMIYEYYLNQVRFEIFKHNMPKQIKIYQKPSIEIVTDYVMTKEDRTNSKIIISPV